MPTNDERPTAHPTEATTTPLDRVIVYEEEGADRQSDLLDIQTPQGRTRVRAVPKAEAVLDLAPELIATGATHIDLCGGFGAQWHARVTEIAGDTSISAIYYGFESLTSVAAYKARFEAGEPLSEAFIIRHPGADPDRDRAVRTKPNGGHTTLIAAPDDSTAAQVAAQLAPDLHLIELYGVPGPTSAAPVINAVSAKIPVGVTAHSNPKTT